MKWISVEDRMPSNDTEVLTIKNNSISDYCYPHTNEEAQLIAFFSGEVWWDSAFPEEVKEDNMVEYVTHWMPLPEPPESNKNKQS